MLATLTWVSLNSMKRSSLFMIPVAALLFLGAGCDDYSQAPSSTYTPQPSVQTEQSPTEIQTEEQTPSVSELEYEPEPPVVSAPPVLEEIESIIEFIPAIVVPTPIYQPEPTPVYVEPIIIEPEPTTSTYCCKICSKGKACGDSCISRSYTCHKGPGCACNAY